MVLKRVKKSNKLILVILVTTLIVTLCISREKDLFSDQATGFAIPQGKVITQITLEGEESSVILTQKQGKWYVNGSDKINREAIAIVQEILFQGEIKSPVSDDLLKEILMDEDPPSTLVKIKGTAGLSRRFTIYSTQTNRFGNIIVPGSGKGAYIITLKGYDLKIGSLFSPRSESWMPYVIFSHMPSEISAISVNYAANDSDSFSITGNPDTGYRFYANGTLMKVDEKKIERYISYFVYVPFTEIWRPPATERAREPGSQLFSVELSLNDGTSVTADFFQVINIEEGERIINSDIIFGKMRQSDNYFIARYYDLDPLLKNVSYFLIGNN